MVRNATVRAWIVGLCTLAGTAVGAHAADLTGMVSDRSRGAIAGARVTLLTTQRSVVAAAITDSNGAYRIDGVPDGTYAVVAAFPRFATDTNYRGTSWGTARGGASARDTR